MIDHANKFEVKEADGDVSIDFVGTRVYLTVHDALNLAGWLATLAARLYTKESERWMRDELGPRPSVQAAFADLLVRIESEVEG